jgi:hypothetical protein
MAGNEKGLALLGCLKNRPLTTEAQYLLYVEVKI